MFIDFKGDLDACFDGIMLGQKVLAIREKPDSVSMTNKIFSSFPYHGTV